MRLVPDDTPDAFKDHDIDAIRASEEKETPEESGRDLPEDGGHDDDPASFLHP